MSRTANARLAGAMFIVYIAAAAAAMALFHRATAGDGATAQLASIARHAPLMRSGIALSLLSVVDALVLALALYALTRELDADLAALALCGGVAAGGITAIHMIAMRALLWMATAANALTADAFGPLLLKTLGWSGMMWIPAALFDAALGVWLLVNVRRQEAAHA